MKYRLQKPKLNAYDFAKLNFIAEFFGYNFKYNSLKCSAMLENVDDKCVGYIQKETFDEEKNAYKLFVVWSNDESIQYIDDLINVAYNVEDIIDINSKAKKKANWLLDILKVTKINCIKWNQQVF